VLLLRDSAAGPEVFLLKRNDKSEVHGGSYVFPGGKVDAADALVDFAAHLDQPPEQLQVLLGEGGLGATDAAAVVFAALRETFEECGVLLADGLTAAQVQRAAALAGEGASFVDILRTLQLRLNTQAVLPWARWITPVNALASPGRRFDTRFFVTQAHAGQQARHDNHEAVESVWVRPRAALEHYSLT
jgi:8-oxo-dGTP pyrophosphatase MutT (NUDIX family)